TLGIVLHQETFFQIVLVLLEALLQPCSALSKPFPQKAQQVATPPPELLKKVPTENLSSGR
ncbi:hypothetical protein ACQP3J_32040, partial [Escherichia coli]